MAFILGSILRYQAILFASHALFHGVADMRAARGDAVGAARARSIARALDRASGLGLWGLATNPGALVEAFEAIKREVLGGGDLVKDLVLLGGSVAVNIYLKNDKWTSNTKGLFVSAS
ncbi:unnamed protein product [Cuscuta campestris]|uniref:Uncharacterized protein n=1 Tax=Cuscuta campestris TaxID=132261 RepID=A0A484LYE5_9ASTE|nr:unnamed protein product [Cuscuta campestris]